MLADGSSTFCQIFGFEINDQSCNINRSNGGLAQVMHCRNQVVVLVHACVSHANIHTCSSEQFIERDKDLFLAKFPDMRNHINNK